MGRTVYLGRGLGFFESFPFLRIGRRLLAFVGPFALHVFCVSRATESPGYGAPNHVTRHQFITQLYGHMIIIHSEMFRGKNGYFTTRCNPKLTRR